MMLLFSHFAQATSLVPTVLGNSTVGTQVVFIPTAALAEAVDMSEYTAGNRQALEGLGFAVVELELSTATPSEIEQTITQADVLFIDGGNTFYLLQELKRTGAYELVKNHIHAGKLYMGNSAGSIITATAPQWSIWIRINSTAVLIPVGWARLISTLFPMWATPCLIRQCTPSSLTTRTD